jgi:hypothetical protein
MQPEEWDRQCALVTKEMGEHVAKFVTPISMSEQHGSGVAWGSGTYFQAPELIGLLTAAHVISDVPDGGRLAHLPKPDGEYNGALGDPWVAPWPIDAGALPVYPDDRFQPARSRVVPSTSIAPFFRAVDGELLFWIGFPGYDLERDDPVMPEHLRSSMFGQLYTPWKPMLSQAIPSPEVEHKAFNPTHHVAVHYPSSGKRALDNSVVPLPNAKGMSGSALWDTKYVATLSQGRPWSPELAEICGVVWGVIDTPKAVFCTKIEGVRAALAGAFMP